MFIPHFLYHSSADGHLDCFHFLAFINNAVINISIHVLCGCMFSFLLGMCVGAESLDHVVYLFKGLRKGQTVFQRGYTI